MPRYRAPLKEREVMCDHCFARQWIPGGWEEPAASEWAGGREVEEPCPHDAHGYTGNVRTPERPEDC